METITRTKINEIKRNNPVVNSIRKENVGYAIYWEDQTRTFFESVDSLLYFFEN